MAANIEFNANLGREAFAMRKGTENPWWGIGHQIDGNNPHDWAKQSGLDWQVIREQGYAASVREVDDGFGATRMVTDYEAIADMQVFRRSDNKKVLCTVGPNTTPLQNENAFDFFYPFIDAGLADFETAMSLDKGRRVVVTAAIRNGVREIVKGDEVKRYITLANSHDGTLAVRVGYTPVRIVCANTLARAISDKRSNLIRIRHGKDVAQRVTDIQQTMDAINATFEATEEQYRALASRKNINQKDLRTYVKTVFKIEEGDNGKLATRTQNTLDDILRIHDKNTGIVQEMIAAMQERESLERETHEILGANLLDAILGNMEAGKGTDIAAARGSWWTAYNSITQFLTHNRGRTPENRVNSNLFGINAETNKLALATAMQMSGLQSA